MKTTVRYHLYPTDWEKKLQSLIFDRGLEKQAHIQLREINAKWTQVENLAIPSKDNIDSSMEQFYFYNPKRIPNQECPQ